ncbi:MAG TPA: hypothetical protein VIQ80_01210 [Candidatus Saccharimonadales bacterium]
MTALTTAYQLPILSGLLQHGNWRTHAVRDGLEVYEDLDAQVRSGDYFVMLATVLDALGRNSQSFETKLELERVVSDLIYLQDHYRITKNEQTGE